MRRGSRRRACRDGVEGWRWFWGLRSRGEQVEYPYSMIQMFIPSLLSNYSCRQKV
jgi:hypothetical protein